MPVGCYPPHESVSGTGGGGNAYGSVTPPIITARPRKSLAQWQKEIHAWAVNKGWRRADGHIDREPELDLGLFTSEISEALECLRANDNPHHVWHTYSFEMENERTGPVKFKNLTYEQMVVLLDPEDEGELDQLMSDLAITPKPEGFKSEIADLVIRILETCETHGIDLEAEIIRKMEYNHTREMRHGGLNF